MAAPTQRATHDHSRRYRAPRWTSTLRHRHKRRMVQRLAAGDYARLFRKIRSSARRRVPLRPALDHCAFGIDSGLWCCGCRHTNRTRARRRSRFAVALTGGTDPGESVCAPAGGQPRLETDDGQLGSCRPIASERSVLPNAAGFTEGTRPGCARAVVPGDDLGRRAAMRRSIRLTRQPPAWGGTACQPKASRGWRYAAARSVGRRGPQAQSGAAVVATIPALYSAHQPPAWGGAACRQTSSRGLATRAAGTSGTAGARVAVPGSDAVAGLRCAARFRSSRPRGAAAACQPKPSRGSLYPAGGVPGSATGGLKAEDPR